MLKGDRAKGIMYNASVQGDGCGVQKTFGKVGRSPCFSKKCQFVFCFTKFNFCSFFEMKNIWKKYFLNMPSAFSCII